MSLLPAIQALSIFLDELSLSLPPDELQPSAVSSTSESAQLENTLDTLVEVNPPPPISNNAGWQQAKAVEDNLSSALQSYLDTRASLLEVFQRELQGRHAVMSAECAQTSVTHALKQKLHIIQLDGLKIVREYLTVLRQQHHQGPDASVDGDISEYSIGSSDKDC